MITCRNCGKGNPDGNEYCGHCGGKLTRLPECKYPPGKEPEEIKRVLKAFLADLHREFPDHIVEYSRWNHEKWDMPAKYLCKQLEYKGLASLLRAYGFRIKRDATGNGSTTGTKIAEKRLSDDKFHQKDFFEIQIDRGRILTVLNGQKKNIPSGNVNRYCSP